MGIYRSWCLLIGALAFAPWISEPWWSNLGSTKQLYKKKKFGVRFIIWSSVRSPESTRLQVWGEIIVDARVVIRNNTERALVHFAQFPRPLPWECCEAVIVEDLKKICREQIEVGINIGI